ncbi:MAG: hypothetical protein IJ982_03040 [Fibrobacter sp.]|nr:hypothetical protein [Fibrobacter sp.]
MENVAADSALNAGAGSAPDSGASLDSGNVAPAMPTPEQLGISVTAGPADGMPAITVGDTFEFPVTVSWSVQGSALLVVPAGSANAKGLTQVGLSQESSRSVKDGKEIASITFTYRIAAQDTGNLHIPALRFEIPTQMGQPIDLRSESVDIRVENPLTRSRLRWVLWWPSACFLRACGARKGGRRYGRPLPRKTPPRRPCANA